MLLDSNEYRIIVESAPNMIWRSGTDAKCYYFNTAWLKFRGRTLDEEQGDGWVQGVHPDDVDFCVKTYVDAFDKRLPFEMEYRLMRHDGVWRWIEDRGVPVFSDSGEFTGYIGSCIDVTEKVEGERLRDMAQKDGLTGLFNRQHFQKLLLGESERSRRYKTPLSVIMLDVDGFKSINDTYGHLAGDKVLKAIAASIRESIRDFDIAGRYGGDEFIVALPNTVAGDALGVAERISSDARKIKLKFSDEPVRIEISFGIGELTPADKRIEKLIDKADKELYKAKASKSISKGR